MALTDENGTSRRSFLLSTAGLATSAWLATQWAAVTAAAHAAGDMAAADIAAAPSWQGFTFFRDGEAHDVEAISGQIIPSDATPGARDAHAVYFIDRALSTFFAAWAVEYRAGLAEFQSRFHATSPAATSFAAVSDAEQITFLKSVDRTPFFETTRMLTIVGMLSAPKYGGNFQGRGWQLLGFEDRHAFSPPFGHYDARYTGFVPYDVKPG